MSLIIFAIKLFASHVGGKAIDSGFSKIFEIIKNQKKVFNRSLQKVCKEYGIDPANFKLYEYKNLTEAENFFKDVIGKDYKDFLGKVLINLLNDLPEKNRIKLWNEIFVGGYLNLEEIKLEIKKLDSGMNILKSIDSFCTGIISRLDDFNFINEEFLSKRRLNEDTQFYNGAEATWDDIMKNRDSVRELQKELNLEKDGKRIILVEGEAGSGKSTLLKRISYDLHERYIVLYHKIERTGLKFEQIEELSVFGKSKIFIVIDKLNRINKSEIEGFLKRISGINLNVSVILTRRTGEALFNESDIPLRIERYELKITKKDLSSIRKKFRKKVDITDRDLLKISKNQMLILVLILGGEESRERIKKKFEEEYRECGEKVKKAYRFVSAFHRTGVLAPKNLLKKIENIDFSIIREKSKGQIISEENMLRTRHEIIAEIVFNYAVDDPEEYYSEIIKNSEENKIIAILLQGLLYRKKNGEILVKKIVKRCEKEIEELTEKSNEIVLVLGWGLIFQKIKLHEKAIGCYKKAIRINPEYAEAHSNLGVLLSDLKRYEEAEKEYREAIRIDPELTEAHANYGLLLFSETENYKEASSELKKAGLLFFKHERNEDAKKAFSICFGLKKHTTNDDIIYCGLFLYLLTYDADVLLKIKKIPIKNVILNSAINLILKKLNNEDITEEIEAIEKEIKTEDLKILFDMICEF